MPKVLILKDLRTVYRQDGLNGVEFDREVEATFASGRMAWRIPSGGRTKRRMLQPEDHKRALNSILETLNALYPDHPERNKIAADVILFDLYPYVFPQYGTDEDNTYQALAEFILDTLEPRLADRSRSFSQTLCGHGVRNQWEPFAIPHYYAPLKTEETVARELASAWYARRGKFWEYWKMSMDFFCKAITTPSEGSGRARELKAKEQNGD